MLLFYLEFLKNIFIIKKIIKFIKNDGIKFILNQSKF